MIHDGNMQDLANVSKNQNNKYQQSICALRFEQGLIELIEEFSPEYTVECTSWVAAIRRLVDFS